jgi:hypothetical protein
MAYDLSDRPELRDIARAWRAWAKHQDAVFIVVHAEVLVAHR